MLFKLNGSFLFFFSVRLLSVLRDHSFFHPRHNGQWPPTSKDFYTRSYPLHLFSYLNSWERASIFPFECSVLNKGTTGTIFITSLVWRGPWLGIEPGISRTRSQHYTTRLSRRRYWTGVCQCALSDSLVYSTVDSILLSSNRTVTVLLDFESLLVIVNTNLF